MDISFLTGNFWYIFGIVFLVGTALLWKTKHQRSFIIFLIRTTRGLNWLDRLGSISPRTWKFLGDLAVIISFGGLGAMYVSKYRKTYPFLLILGVITLILTLPVTGAVVAGGLFLLLLLVLFGINKLPTGAAGKASFLLTVVIMFSAFLGFSSNLQPGIASLAISLITGIFGLPGLLVGALSSQASLILLQESSLPGVSPLLPGLSPEGQIGFIFPGFDIFIPLWSGLLALIILLVSHEFSHGILARVQKIPVKNMGLLTFGVIPIGAFVEPDEKALEKKKSEEKMRVYSMGSFTNLVVAAIAILLVIPVSLTVGGMVETQGIEVVSVQEGFPAEIMESGTIIHKINGVEVTSVDEYINESSKVNPGDDIVLETDKGTIRLKSVPAPDDPSKAYLGFNLRTQIALKQSLAGQEGFFGSLLALNSLLEIIFFLNFNVAIVNLLPVVPFDGSKMFDELLKSFNLKREKRKKIIKWVVALIVLLLLVNALPLGRVFLSYLGA